MDKIKENKRRYYITTSILSYVLLMPLMVLSGYVSLIEFTFYFFLIIPFAFAIQNFSDWFYGREEKYGVIFSEGGIRFFTRFGKGFDIPWNELIIQKRVGPNRFFTEFIFVNSNNAIKSNSRIIYWPNEVSYIELVKKYSPKDHDLYKLVEEHSKKRGIEF